VLSLIAGIGWIIQSYVAALGDAAILTGLTSILFASFYYCFSRALPYSPGEVESPALAFDYILYLASLTFALEIGYIESRFHLMQSEWDYYLLISAALFFALAYRFDNRLVLSLALSTLGGWFGIRMSRSGFFFGESVRGPGLIYGAGVIGAGAWLFSRNIKKHFTETYFHVGVIVVFAALVSGVVQDSWLYLFLVLCMAAIAIAGGIRFSKFAFVVYGIIFSYIAISTQLLRGLSMGSTAALSYFVVSGSLVILSMVLLANRLGREA
jgi:hypothetical protein